MSSMASQIAGVSTVCSAVCSGADQRGIHQWSMDSPHKGPVTRKMISFGDVIMRLWHFRFNVSIEPSVPYDNVIWAGPTSGRQYGRWANVGPTYIAIWVQDYTLNLAGSSQGTLQTCRKKKSLNYFATFDDNKIWPLNNDNLGMFNGVFSFVQYSDYR